MCTGRGSNQGPLGPKSDALTTAPPGGGGGGGGGQGGCELRSEAFVKIQKKNFFWGEGGSGWGGGGVRVDVN